MSFPCVKCGVRDTVVKDSRPTGIGLFAATRRRRLCVSCGHRFSTFETHEAMRTDIKKITAAQNALSDVEAALVRARKIVGPAETPTEFDSNM